MFRAKVSFKSGAITFTYWPHNVDNVGQRFSNAQFNQARVVRRCIILAFSAVKYGIKEHKFWNR